MFINYYEKYQEYISKGEPIPYKDFLIYPVLWKDAHTFLSSYDILNIRKDEIPDTDIIRMSYLSFILELVKEDKYIKENFSNIKTWQEKLECILKLCLNLTINENTTIEYENDRMFLNFNGKKLSEKDFEYIRKIIMYQNIYEYEDMIIDTEVRKSIEIYYKIINKEIMSPSLEKKETILMTGANISLKDMREMTYRQCEILFETINDKIEYQLNKLISHMPYIDSSKMKLDHWIYKKFRNKYEEAFTDAEEFKNKFKDVV